MNFNFFLRSAIAALCATPLTLGAQTFTAGSAARVTLVPSFSAAGSQAPVSAGVATPSPTLAPASSLSALQAAPAAPSPALSAASPALAAPALAAPIATVVSARTLAPITRPEAGRQAETAAALNLVFDAARGPRAAALETAVLSAASVSDKPGKIMSPVAFAQAGLAKGVEVTQLMTGRGGIDLLKNKKELARYKVGEFPGGRSRGGRLTNTVYEVPLPGADDRLVPRVIVKVAYVLTNDAVGYKYLDVGARAQSNTAALPERRMPALSETLSSYIQKNAAAARKIPGVKDIRRMVAESGRFRESVLVTLKGNADAAAVHAVLVRKLPQLGDFVKDVMYEQTSGGITSYRSMLIPKRAAAAEATVMAAPAVPDWLDRKTLFIAGNQTRVGREGGVSLVLLDDHYNKVSFFVPGKAALEMGDKPTVTFERLGRDEKAGPFRLDLSVRPSKFELELAKMVEPLEIPKMHPAIQDAVKSFFGRLGRPAPTRR